MSMPAIKAEATTVAIPTASPNTAAPVVTMTPKQAPRAEKYVKMAKEAAVRVVPPLVVLALLMLFWELVCRRTGSTLPPPSTRLQGNQGTDLRSVLRSWRHRQGSVLAFVRLAAARRATAIRLPPSSASRSARWSGSRYGRCAGSIRCSRCFAPSRRWHGCRCRSPRSVTASPRRSSSSSSPRSGRSSSTPRSASATSRRTTATSPPSCSSIRWSSSPRS